MTLSTYRTDARRLLHDPNGDVWSDATLNAFINEAVQKRDRITACNRSLQTLTLVIGTDNYAFSLLTNTRVFDVVNVNIITNGQRLILSRLSWSKLNARVRYLSPSWRGVPQAWALYGQSTVYLAPAPSIAYSSEWDCCVYSAELTADGSDDSVNYPYTEPVKYYVAYLAKLNERRFDAADDFLARFDKACLDTAQATRGIVPNAYATR